MMVIMVIVMVMLMMVLIVVMIVITNIGTTACKCYSLGILFSLIVDANADDVMMMV